MIEKWRTDVVMEEVGMGVATTEEARIDEDVSEEEAFSEEECVFVGEGADMED